MQDFPAVDAIAVTPHDLNPIREDGIACRALYVGVSGNIAGRTRKGTSITLANVPVGILPIQFTHIFSTGTGASSLVALL